MSALLTILLALTLVSWIWGGLDVIFYAKDSRSKPFWLMLIIVLPIVGSLIYFHSRFWLNPIDR